MNIKFLGSCEIKFYNQLNKLKSFIERTGINYFNNLKFLKKRDIIIDNYLTLSAYCQSTSFVMAYFEIFRDFDIIYYSVMFIVSQNGNIIYPSLIYQKITRDEFCLRKEEFYKNE